MKNALILFYQKGKNALDNEKGAQALEWLGLAALLIMVLGIISTTLTGNFTIKGIVDKILQAISKQIG
jgi:hypothetical protein